MFATENPDKLNHAFKLIKVQTLVRSLPDEFLTESGLVTHKFTDWTLEGGVKGIYRLRGIYLSRWTKGIEVPTTVLCFQNFLTPFRESDFET